MRQPPSESGSRLDEFASSFYHRILFAAVTVRRYHCRGRRTSPSRGLLTAPLAQPSLTLREPDRVVYQVDQNLTKTQGVADKIPTNCLARRSIIPDPCQGPSGRPRRRGPQVLDDAEEGLSSHLCFRQIVALLSLACTLFSTFWCTVFLRNNDRPGRRLEVCCGLLEVHLSGRVSAEHIVQRSRETSVAFEEKTKPPGASLRLAT